VIVLKFGGTSVGGPDPIRRLGEIVRRALDRKPTLVVSAVSGVTNRLFKLVELALAEGEWLREFEAIEEQHRSILRALGLSPELVDGLLDELHQLVCGVSLIRECTPRVRDYLVSFGERLSVRLVAAHLVKTGIPASAHDSFDVGLVTDEHFGCARPLADVDDRIREAFRSIRGVPVVTGYIGKSVSGHITTLGRGGSDYSASIFGAALDADEIQIWTDVDGVMTADPRIVKGSRFIPKLSFAEASELAFYGAKVLHPATMIPAVRKNIPIRVLNSYRPEFEGTTVVADLGPGEKGVKSIASKDRICVVDIVAPPMIFQYGFLEKIAGVFARHEIVIDMISTSEVSVAMTTEPAAKLEPVVAELSKFCEATVQRDMSLVSVVGEELKERTDFDALVFGVIAKLGVRIEMISYGATRNNLAFVVRQDRVKEVVTALHQELFERN
jgi:aspartate kinase